MLPGRQSFTGDLGGLVGADEKCIAAALQAGLPNHLNYLAWLSDGDSSTDPASRFSRAGSPYIKVGDDPIAFNWAHLTAGLLFSPIDIDENGARRGGGGGNSVEVWTNVLRTGETNIVGTDPEGNCRAWGPEVDPDRGPLGRGAAGEAGVLRGWTESGRFKQCRDDNGALYCFEQ